MHSNLSVGCMKTTREKSQRRSARQGHSQPGRLGIDIGRVIIAPPSEEGSDTSFLGGTDESAMLTRPSEGAFDAIADLTNHFEGRVWLVSKCGPKIQQRTRLWLAHWRFFEHTGIPKKNLRFCRQRPQKADHCAKLGINYFVDDRVDVLRHLRGLVRHLFLFGPQQRGIPEWSTPVQDWSEARSALLARAR